ncbi:alpha/beta hydrolase [Nocardia sp. NBC_00508]|uniref:alpha/beta fold hydrolase n=1 Tax=Nocardia sp. NBC_00508 TaxID=2975992 RepID=UPI002E810A93|nr:alpha/beta hydrolase [Nocardia sp. NBC_00508]WUD66114.1 alpha/beta hydrolase [Nocardia sp. NBC_00508]
MESIQSRAAAFERDLERRNRRIGPHDWSFHVGGGGDAVVLLPGGAGIAIGWLDLAPALHLAYRVVAVDYPSTATTFDELADGVVAILDGEGIGSAQVVGQSAGGMLAEVLSQRAPDRVRSIVFTGTGLYGPEDESRLAARVAATDSTPWEQTRAAAREALRSAWKDSGEAEFWVECVDVAYQRSGQRGAANSLRCLLDLARRLPELQQQPAWQGPSLIVRADDDSLITGLHLQRLRELHPHSEFRPFSDGGHSLLVSRPSDYVATVTDFLNRHRGD